MKHIVAVSFYLLLLSGCEDIRPAKGPQAKISVEAPAKSAAVVDCRVEVVATLTNQDAASSTIKRPLVFITQVEIKDFIFPESRLMEKGGVLDPWDPESPARNGKHYMVDNFETNRPAFVYIFQISGTDREIGSLKSCTSADPSGSGEVERDGGQNNNSPSAGSCLYQLSQSLLIGKSSFTCLAAANHKLEISLSVESNSLVFNKVDFSQTN